MRVDNFGPKTWLLAGVAGWAVCLWTFAMFGLGERLGKAEDGAQPQALPSTAIPRVDRPGPQAQYAEIANRPIFSETRKPQQFMIDGTDQGAQANTFDYILTSVLIAGDVQLAILKPAADGAAPVRVKLGDALEVAPQWTLASLQPRSAVFRGPDGDKSLELRVFNGIGGAVPPPIAPPPPPASSSGVVNETIPPPGVAPPVQPPPGNDANVSTQVQLEAIRKRIEARRAQLRQQSVQDVQQPQVQPPVGPPGQSP